MENRIALIGIIVEPNGEVERLNAILHDYAPHIVCRMGVPYRPRNVSIMSVVLDATNNIISSLSGKLGMLEGVNVKTVYSNLSADEKN